MGIRRWFSRRMGSYSINLAVAEEIIKEILHKNAVKIKEINDYRVIDKIMVDSVDMYKVTDPQYHEAFMEKWTEIKKRIYQYEFDKKKEKYT